MKEKKSMTEKSLKLLSIITVVLGMLAMFGTLSDILRGYKDDIVILQQLVESFALLGFSFTSFVAYRIIYYLRKIFEK